MIRRLDSKKDEAELVKCTFWALCNVIRTNAVILPCQYLAINTLAKIILQSEDLEMLSDCLFALSDLTTPEIMTNLAELGLLPRLYRISKRGYRAIVPPIITMINYLSSSENPAMTTAIIQTGFVEFFFEILADESYQNKVKVDTLWILSNITVGLPEQIESVINHPKKLETILAFCNSQNVSLAKEATWTLCNVTRGGTESQKQALIEAGIFSMFRGRLLDPLSSEKVIRTILEALGNLLKGGVDMDSMSPNAYHIMVQESGLADALERLQVHENYTVYEAVLSIIDEYLETEDPF